MLIDLIAMQKQKFQQLAEKIIAKPEQYLNFDSVSDFYKATWLNEFPNGTTWTVTGLDDGADEFDICIEYRDVYLIIEYTSQLKVYMGKIGKK
ncbi:hypothetical protein [Acinetobacter sp. CFCC 10889]|uniref:hypothetical protein n=1 Tax=Acinetobacter sp. CFCC 10889 TaxID=1775557 RepID=UPI000DCFEA5A|nr:hypothetical protein [Acinetobacter sp. CFCC 10889]